MQMKPFKPEMGALERDRRLKTAEALGKLWVEGVGWDEVRSQRKVKAN